MYKKDLALNNLQWLIYHKTKPNPTIMLRNFFTSLTINLIINIQLNVYSNVVIFFFFWSLEKKKGFVLFYSYLIIVRDSFLLRDPLSPWGSKYLSKLNSFLGFRGRVFTNDPIDWDSIPGQVIPKTQKMILDASLLNTQHYEVCIKGKVE